MQALLKKPLNIKKWISTQDLRLKLLELKINRFTPKVRFTTTVKNFTIKTADTPAELREVLELRHQIFIEEWLGEDRFGGVDFDRYDLLGDHVLLIDNKTQKIIGTYRLMCSRFTDKFYSDNEFHLNYFLKSPGIKLELGRACIHKDYRNGASIHLVWKALGRYASLVDADYMFGCTSIHTTSYSKISCMINSFKPFNFSDDFHIRPKFNYRYSLLKRKEIVDVDAVNSLVPSLLKSYFNAGAKVYGAPALDREFNCTDLLTILDLRKMPEKHLRKYILQELK